MTLHLYLLQSMSGPAVAVPTYLTTEAPLHGWKLISHNDELILELEFNPKFIPDRSVRYTARGRAYQAIRMEHSKSISSQLPQTPTFRPYLTDSLSYPKSHEMVKALSSLPEAPSAPLTSAHYAGYLVLAAGRIGLPSQEHVTTVWESPTPPPPSPGILLTPSAFSVF